MNKFSGFGQFFWHKLAFTSQCLEQNGGWIKNIIFHNNREKNTDDNQLIIYKQIFYQTNIYIFLKL